MQTTTDQTARSPSIAERVSQCPACGYSWHVLPAEGHCPECSLPYDHFSHQWLARVETPQPLAAIIGFGLIIVFGLLAGPHVGWQLFGSSGMWATFAAISVIAALFLCGWALETWISRKRPCKIAVLPEILVVRARTGSRAHTWRWQEVSRVQAWQGSDFAVLHITAGPLRQTYQFRGLGILDARYLLGGIRHYAPHVVINTDSNIDHLMESE